MFVYFVKNSDGTLIFDPTFTSRLGAWCFLTTEDLQSMRPWIDNSTRLKKNSTRLVEGYPLAVLYACWITSGAADSTQTMMGIYGRDTISRFLMYWKQYFLFRTRPYKSETVCKYWTETVYTYCHLCLETEHLADSSHRYEYVGIGYRSLNDLKLDDYLSCRIKNSKKFVCWIVGFYVLNVAIVTNYLGILVWLRAKTQI